MEKCKTFIALDFETIQATAIDGNRYNHLPISVGIVKVIDGKIMQKFQSLIKPPVKEDWQGIKSGLSSNDCKHAPSYDELFPILNKLIGFHQLVAYGHGTENSVLNEMERYYHIEHSCLFKNQFMSLGGEQFIDPLEILKSRGEKKNKLIESCERYNIKLQNAHDSLCDAEATAILLLKLQETDTDNIPIQEKASNPASYIGRPKKDKSFFNKELPINEIINQNTIFFRKKVCCTGFPVDVVDDVNYKMYLLGAIVKSNISQAQTDLLILGPDAARSTSKIAKAKEWKKTIITLKELKSALEKEGELDETIARL